MPLPDITIKTQESPQEFLLAMQEIFQRTSEITEIRAQWEIMGDEGFSIVGVMPKEQHGNTDLIGQLISKKNDCDRIDIEIRAKVWGEGFPSYDEYVQRAKDIFLSPLKEYNREHGKRYRLTIHKIREKPLKLPPGAEQYFNRFTMYPQSGISHPLERKRFHAFIKYCYRYGVKLDKSEFVNLLIMKEFNSNEAEQLGEIYEHGREILSVGLWG